MNRNAMTIDSMNVLNGYRERGARSSAKDNLALAMAYMPMQCLKNAYCLEDALYNGTLFPELDKPFTGVKGGCACG